MNEVLQFENVSMHYHTKQGETVAVEDLTFSVSEGEFVAIIGPSGCGKTTLLSLAAGLLSPTKGEVKNSGVSFGYMLQKDELFPWRTIEKNIFLPLEIKKMDTAENRARALALAEKYQTRLSVCDDVYKIIRSEHKTAVLITHDISEAVSVADKIVVLSRRPARVVSRHTLSFPENEPLKRRENKEFSTWFELLWRELNA